MSSQTFLPSTENKIGEYLYQMPFAGMYYLAHKHFPDERGFYSELFRLPELEQVRGKPFQVVQGNLSFSQPNVMRGFHAEDWNKLLTVVAGACFCAWADFRPESKTFGQVTSMMIAAPKATNENYGSIFVPAGIGNAFCTTDQSAHYYYAVDALYAERDKSGDVAISLFDPDLAVEWPADPASLIISDRDKQAISLRAKFPNAFR